MQLTTAHLQLDAVAGSRIVELRRTAEPYASEPDVLADLETLATCASEGDVLAGRWLVNLADAPVGVDQTFERVLLERHARTLPGVTHMAVVAQSFAHKLELDGALAQVRGPVAEVKLTQSRSEAFEWLQTLGRG